MKPIGFDGQNIVYAAKQPSYLPLPAHVTDEGLVTSRWALSFKERLRVLFTGEVWVTIQTHNQPLQPSRVWARRPLWIPTTEESSYER